MLKLSINNFPIGDRNMNLKSTIKKLDTYKKKVGPNLDKLVGMTALNLGASYKALSMIEDSSLTESTEHITLLGVGAVLAVGNYALLKSDKTNLLRKVYRDMDSLLQKNRPLSWLKTGILATAMIAGISTYSDHFSKDSIQETTSSFHEEKCLFELSDLVISSPKNKLKRPAFYEELSYEPLYEPVINQAFLTGKYSINGRIQRTLRWENIYHSVEEKHGLPKNLLGAMIMQESLGDPLQPNNTADGGLGLSHIQGTTGNYYGLHIYGSSTSHSDHDHGADLLHILTRHKYDFSIMHLFDERAHPIKNLDAAARIITHGMDKFGGDVRRGVRFYRGGSESAKAKYWSEVSEWKNMLDCQETVQKAIDQFNQRNPSSSYKEYQEKFLKANVNWGLNTYRESSFD
jgi:hypothetical protein